MLIVHVECALGYQPSKLCYQDYSIFSFSLWNNIMGTSLLSMLWAINQTGLVTGIIFCFLLLTMGYFVGYVIFISRRTIMAGYYGFTLDVCVSVRPSARAFVFRFQMIT